MRTLAPTLLLSLAALLPAADARAVPRPVGDPIVIGIDGLDANFAPAIASDAAGNFVVVWDRWLDQDGSQSEIVFRKFTAAGRSVSPRFFEVNQHRPDYQQWPDVAMNAGGWFAATWASNNQDGSGFGIYARLFRGRQPVSAEIHVPTPARALGEQRFPKVAIDGAGNFLVAWDGPSPEQAGDLFDVWARRFDNAGRPLGRPLRIPTVHTGSQGNPDVAMHADGSHLVVWRAWGQGGTGAAIFGRRFDAAGRPLGAAFQISTGAIPSAGTPTVTAAPDGGFLVAWDRCDFANPFFGCGVLARRYDAAGRPLSGEFLVSPEDFDTHKGPAVAFNRGGDFAVTWNLCQSHPSGQLVDCRIATQFFRRGGSPETGLLVIDADTNLLSPRVVGIADQFLVAFDSSACDFVSCGNGPQGVFALRFRLQ